MELCVNLKVPSGPWWARPRLLVLVLIVIVLAIGTMTGYTMSDIITVILGTGLLGAQVARSSLETPLPDDAL